MTTRSDTASILGLSYYFNMTGQGLGITHIVNTAEGNKSANVTLDVDQLEANGNLVDRLICISDMSTDIAW